MIKGTGIDILELSRISAWCDEKHVSRILSKDEIAHFNTISDPRVKLQYLGGRFSVKEAIFKAISKRVGHTTFTDLVVLNDPSGKPYLKSHPFDPDLIIHLSISHTDHVVIAQAIIEKV